VLPYGQLIFLAINVNRTQELKAYNDLFEAQMNKILDLTRHGLDSAGRRGMGLVSRLEVDDPRDHIRAKEQVKKAIQTAYRAGNRFADALNGEVDSGGCALEASGDPDDLLGTQACAFLMDEVRSQGWATPESGSTVISEEGWVLRQKGNQEFVEPWVWLSRNEVFTFAGFLSGLLTAGSNAERAADVIAQTVSATTGDKFLEGETIADYVRRVYQLPFRNDMILRYTPDQLQRKLLDGGNFKEQFEQEIGRSLERLTLAANEQKPDVQLTWDQSRGRWLRPPTEQIPTEKRWAASLGVEVYGWFPLRYLPGGVD
jgi:hypothetical protein